MPSAAVAPVARGYQSQRHAQFRRQRATRLAASTFPSTLRSCPIADFSANQHLLLHNLAASPNRRRILMNWSSTESTAESSTGIGKSPDSLRRVQPDKDSNRESSSGA